MYQRRILGSLADIVSYICYFSLPVVVRYAKRGADDNQDISRECKGKLSGLDTWLQEWSSKCYIASAANGDKD